MTESSSLENLFGTPTATGSQTGSNFDPFPSSAGVGTNSDPFPSSAGGSNSDPFPSTTEGSSSAGSVSGSPTSTSISPGQTLADGTCATLLLDTIAGF